MAVIVPLEADVGKPKRLLEQVCDVMRLKHYSLRTERSYCDWIERFIRFHAMRHPQEMGEAEVSAFLTHLAREGQVAASMQNQHVKASLTCQEQVKSRCVLRLRT